ncbi:outer membrane pore protein E [Klebsiella pneumoniae]|uniref:Outer membrane pore protein E n=1 Tax=Klebsiella pneumoniae TaxID=573 RepID=A0A447S0L8_KLEPN|nr:outer membrane pore protein E [Klebsiella pneumoniae]
MHYFSDYDSKDGDQTYVRFGIKGETQINGRPDRLMAVGNLNSPVTKPRATPARKPVWRSPA